MAVIFENTSDITTDFSDLGAGWRKVGNISLTHDRSRATFKRASTGDSAAFVYPFPATFGAGFVETAVTSDFRMVVDMAIDTAVESISNEYVGISLRAANFAQWIYLNPASSLVRSQREDGLGNLSLIEGTTIPTSASLRWDIEVHWTGALVAGRIRPYESKGDPSAWTPLNITAASSLASAPEWAGLGMAGTVNVHAPELHVYSLRISDEGFPAGSWYALADIPAPRKTVSVLLQRKSRATAEARWSRDDYAIAGSSKTLTNITPLRSQRATFDPRELTRYRAALEHVTGLDLALAWFNTPRCAVTGAHLRSANAPSIVTASDVSKAFGSKVFNFGAVNDQSFAAFDHSLAEVSDTESWLAFAVVSPTVVPGPANVPLFGKQDLFQVAPTPRNGWMVWMNTGDVMLDLSDTAGGSNSITAAKVYSAGTFYCVAARINRTTNLA